MQVGLYSGVSSPDNTTPQERRIVGMAGIAHAAIAQKPASAAMALKFLKAYQADPGYAVILRLRALPDSPVHDYRNHCAMPYALLKTCCTIGIIMHHHKVFGAQRCSAELA